MPGAVAFAGGIALPEGALEGPTAGDDVSFCVFTTESLATTSSVALFVDAMEVVHCSVCLSE